ncbi:hypothetical protein H6781_02095 [Candidatus Nomurabacteria bacterium]|nr:hypothetical protein [Candidatus Nomurabacteria bacterium]MCB9818053.1 hypothetical protein [Candidatus Nomurabacteria bacterium]
MFEGFFGAKKKPEVEQVDKVELSKTIEEMEESARIYKEEKAQEPVEEPIKYDNGIDWQNPEEMLDKEEGGVFTGGSLTKEDRKAIEKEK